MNFRSIITIYNFEINRGLRTLAQSVVSPVISTTLYLIIFGSVTRISDIDGINYGSYIVPGLILITVLTTSVSNSSFGIFFPRFTGTIYEILSAPISFLEILFGYIGAAATKSVVIGLIILFTAFFFVPVEIKHPFWMFSFLILISVSFCLLGFIIGIWAEGFDKLQIIPLLIISPLSFLGGSFYSIKMLPAPLEKLSLLNPVVYLVSLFRWSFFGHSDVRLTVSLGVTFLFLILCLAVVAWIFKTGYRLKN